MSKEKIFSINVLLTSFGRTEYLRRCLKSLVIQTYHADKIIVIARDTDWQTQKLVDDFSQQNNDSCIVLTTVAKPGVIAANNAAYPLLSGDIVAFLDDDSTAPPFWLERLVRHYNEPKVGAVGGLIKNHRYGMLLNYNNFSSKKSNRIDCFGRVHGGQMAIFSGIVEVDHLTGCNMSFRRNLLVPCDRNIKGDGFRYEMDLCLAVQNAGYRIIMDSEAYNFHWSAPRKEGLPRDNKTVVEYNNQYNEMYVILKHRRHVGLCVLLRMIYFFPRVLFGSILRKKKYGIYYVLGSLAGMWRGLTIGRHVQRKICRKFINSNR